MYSVWATSIVAVLVCAVGAKNNAETQLQIDKRIINGRDAEIEEVPYQVAIEFWEDDDDKKSFCGGVIISSNVILTAAHCVAPVEYGQIELSELRIRAGSSQRLQGGVVKEIAKLFVHEDHEHFRNDIALLKLNDELEFSNQIQVVKLPDEDIPANTTATISGWGYTDGSDEEPNTLQVGSAFILGQDDCNEKYPQYNLPPSIICAERGDDPDLAFTCRGDSGGPLVRDGVVYGVSSFGNGPCDERTLAGFTRITSFRDWISDKVQL